MSRRASLVAALLPLRRLLAGKTPVPPHGSLDWRGYLSALAITAACTSICFPVADYFGLINIVMLYLLGTTLGALRLGRGPCVLLSISNTLALDFFFVPPVFSFDVADAEYLFTLVVMLTVALVISNLMISIRKHRAAAAAREHRTAVLYAMSRELAVATDAPAMAAAAVRQIGAVFHSDALVLIADARGHLTPVPNPQDSPSAQPGARESLRFNAQTAGEVVARAERSVKEAIYLPLPGGRRVEGVIVVRPPDHPGALPAEQLNLLDAFAVQLALALQRVRLAEEAEAAKISEERALLRNTLLASISHDLRTPLSAIAGAGSLIGQPEYALNADRLATLGKLIERKARDVTQLLTNVLDLVKMEFGSRALNADWHDVDELVSVALRPFTVRLSDWNLVLDLPMDLPMVLVDPTLMTQLLGNLFENAAKYTPPGTTITVSAAVRAGEMVLSVADDGPGLPACDPDLLFEKFQRGFAESNIVGVGLGLAICRAAARLHGGDIRALRDAHGGARFEITLPVIRQVETQLVPESC